MKDKKYNIGACDWSLGQNSKLAAFDVAKSIGLDGIQVNLGTRQEGMHLRNKNTQIQFRDKAKETGIAISSMAIRELNNVPYKSDIQTDAWVFDAIDAATFFNVGVVLLAFFSKNDLRNIKNIDPMVTYYEDGRAMPLYFMFKTSNNLKFKYNFSLPTCSLFKKPLFSNSFK